MANNLSTVFWGAKEGFIPSIQEAINNLNNQDGIFTGDQLFTFGRNLSFLSDHEFMAAFEKNAKNPIEKAIIWRTAVLAWAARHAMHLDGDFIECACYKGTTAKIICDVVDFEKSNKKYYLYDLFEHDPSMPHHAMAEHSKELYAKTQARFADYPNVIVSAGKVPDILHEVAPEKISFMHIDLNNAPAEIGALEVLFERMVPGAILVLDDYGWIGYGAQKIAEDPWLAERGYLVLELPTGQGLVFKR